MNSFLPISLLVMGTAISPKTSSSRWDRGLSSGSGELTGGERSGGQAVAEDVPLFVQMFVEESDEDAEDPRSRDAAQLQHAGNPPGGNAGGEYDV